MAYNNYGGGHRAPAPREQHGPQHTLPSRFESILKEQRSLGKNFKTVGKEPSRDTIMFNGDPARASITVAKAAMIMRNTGIPLDHPEYPPVSKFDSEFPDERYYFNYVGPITWKKDPRFRHIPTYTRYVIDQYGRVLNAFNGMAVEPESNGFNYKLIGDGANTKPFYVSKEKLMILAWCPLPEDFVDYGFGTHSHRLEVDTKAGQFTWVPREPVKVRNNESGETRTYKCLPDFVECALKDFELQKEVRPYFKKTHLDSVITVGPFSIKSGIEVEPIFPLPGDDADDAETTTENMAVETTAEPSMDEGFDDIDF